jgi:spoIIIJ-associated protein
MEWVETTGRSVEEAKDAALDQLGVDENDAEFVVMSEPRSGLFGRMRGEARVRARVRPTSPRPKRTRARRQGEETRSQRRPRGGEPGANEGRRREAATSVAQRAGSDERSRAGEGARGDPGGSGDSPGGEGGARGQGNRRRRAREGASRRITTGASARSGGTGSGNIVNSGLDQDARETTDGLREPIGAKKEEAVGEDLSLEEQGESAREFLEGLVHLLGLSGSVTMSIVDAETVQVAIDGAELGVLIGPGGGTLSALQELARTVVQRRTGGRSERILVDVAGYRAKRAAALQRFARGVADEVLASSTEQALEPMSASDRKVVHDTVNELDGLVTRSVGEEPRRYIVVAPASSTDSAETADSRQAVEVEDA